MMREQSVFKGVFTVIVTDLQDFYIINRGNTSLYSVGAVTDTSWALRYTGVGDMKLTFGRFRLFLDEYRPQNMFIYCSHTLEASHLLFPQP